MSQPNSQRPRSSSVRQALQQVPAPPNASGPGVSQKPQPLQPWEEPSHGFLDDLVTMRWMCFPASSFRIILLCGLGWAIYEGLRRLLSLSADNPFTPLFIITRPLPLQIDETHHRYGKDIQDIKFLAFYIVVFSCIRQSLTEYVIKPYAQWLQLPPSKQQRFVDQGYAVFYWGSSSIIGLFVMSKQPTWWYNTREFWAGYPHWRMEPSVKVYYLLQFSYWLQQMLLLTLKIEKPRSDFVELCIHHCVTLWLVGWSYIFNLTMIGTAIFVSMDIPDTFLGISKCINYTKYQHTSEVSLVIFIAVWTYFRHWQNLRILWSVFFEYDTVTPFSARQWAPEHEAYLTGWVKWQVFAPIMLLQLLNLFWYYLIWRIIFRWLWTGETTDVREEGDGDGVKED